MTMLTEVRWDRSSEWFLNWGFRGQEAGTFTGEAQGLNAQIFLGPQRHG
jgi:hypothetical protein